MSLDNFGLLSYLAAKICILRDEKVVCKKLFYIFIWFLNKLKVFDDNDDAIFFSQSAYENVTMDAITAIYSVEESSHLPIPFYIKV